MSISKAGRGENLVMKMGCGQGGASIMFGFTYLLSEILNSPVTFKKIRVWAGRSSPILVESQISTFSRRPSALFIGYGICRSFYREFGVTSHNLSFPCRSTLTSLS